MPAFSGLESNANSGSSGVTAGIESNSNVTSGNGNVFGEVQTLDDEPPLECYAVDELLGDSTSDEEEEEKIVAAVVEHEKGLVNANAKVQETAGVNMQMAEEKASKTGSIPTSRAATGSNGGRKAEPMTVCAKHAQLVGPFYRLLYSLPNRNEDSNIDNPAPTLVKSLKTFIRKLVSQKDKVRLLAQNQNSTHLEHEERTAKKEERKHSKSARKHTPLRVGHSCVCIFHGDRKMYHATVESARTLLDFHSNSPSLMPHSSSTSMSSKEENSGIVGTSNLHVLHESFGDDEDCQDWVDDEGSDSEEGREEKADSEDEELDAFQHVRARLDKRYLVRYEGYGNREELGIANILLQ